MARFHKEHVILTHDTETQEIGRYVGETKAMSRNYEWNKQLTRQQLQSRYEEADRHRLVQQANPAPRRQYLRWLNPFIYLAAIWRMIPRRHEEPAPRPRGATEH